MREKRSLGNILSIIGVSIDAILSVIGVFILLQSGYTNEYGQQIFVISFITLALTVFAMYCAIRYKRVHIIVLLVLSIFGVLGNLPQISISAGLILAGAIISLSKQEGLA